MARRRAAKRIGFVIAFIAALVCAGLVALLKHNVEPNMEEMARIRAEALVSRSVSTALAEQFQGETAQEDLFSVKIGEDGSLEMVQADSAHINLLMSRLSVSLQKSFQGMKHETFAVPIGSLLGSKFLSQAGPEIELSIIPMSVSSMDFRTEFETQGINQTKYKIYIVLSCRIRVIAPFSARTFQTSSTVLVAETVILGEVPDSYIEVPEEDILDVT